MKDPLAQIITIIEIGNPVSVKSEVSSEGDVKVRFESPGNWLAFTVKPDGRKSMAKALRLAADAIEHGRNTFEAPAPSEPPGTIQSCTEEYRAARDFAHRHARFFMWKSTAVDALISAYLEGLSSHLKEVRA